MVDANVTGTERVIAACTTAGVKRLVHTSSVVAIGLTTTGAPSDETATLELRRARPLRRVRDHEAPGRGHRPRAASIDAVIVNPTYMFGPRDARPSSGKMIVDVARRRVPSWTPGYNNFVDVRDVARGMIAAWQRGKRGERYILGGHDMTYKQCFDTIARVAGVKPPRFERAATCREAARRVGRLPGAPRQGTDRQLHPDPLRVHRQVPVHVGARSERARLHARPTRARDRRRDHLVPRARDAVAPSARRQDAKRRLSAVCSGHALRIFLDGACPGFTPRGNEAKSQGAAARPRPLAGLPWSRLQTGCMGCRPGARVTSNTSPDVPRTIVSRSETPWLGPLDLLA